MHQAPPCRGLGAQCKGLRVTLRIGELEEGPESLDHEATWLLGHTERITFLELWEGEGDLTSRRCSMFLPVSPPGRTTGNVPRRMASKVRHRAAPDASLSRCSSAATDSSSSRIAGTRVRSLPLPAVAAGPGFTAPQRRRRTLRLRPVPDGGQYPKGRVLP
jgi:hypothetical protein